MRFGNHVSVVWDITAFLDYVGAQPAVHNHLLLTASPPFLIPKPLSLSVEAPVPILWPPGFLLGANKLTSSVYHNHVWFGLEKHDCGPMIFHLSVDPPVDLLMPVHLISSSRKAKFKAGEVKANGAAVACMTMIDPSAIVPTPLLVCGDIPSPTSGTGSAVWLNSLLVGMHLADLIMGWVDTLVSMVFATLKAAAGGQGAVEFSPGTYGLADVSVMPDLGALAGALVGLAFQEWGGYRGDVGFEYKPVGGHLFEVGVGISRDGDSHDVQFGGAGRLGPDGANVHGGRSFTRHPGADGQPARWTMEDSGGVGSYGAHADLKDAGPGTDVHGSNRGWSSPISEGTGWDDLPLL